MCVPEAIQTPRYSSTIVSPLMGIANLVRKGGRLVKKVGKEGRLVRKVGKEGWQGKVGQEGRK